MSDTPNATHRPDFNCPETEEHAARHAARVHSEADHDDFLDTVFGDTYEGKHRGEVTS